MMGCGAQRPPHSATAPGATEPAGHAGAESTLDDPWAQGWHALAQPSDDAGDSTPAARIDLSFAASYVGKHPSYLVEALTANAAVDARLRTLLDGDYDDWGARFEVASQVERSGAFVIAEGCMAHACAGVREAIVVIDLDRGLISVGLVTDGRGTVHSEAEQIPEPLKDWLVKESAP